MPPVALAKGGYWLPFVSYGWQASPRRTHPTRLTDMANIAVLGALDTKGAEVAFLRDQIAERGPRAARHRRRRDGRAGVRAGDHRGRRSPLRRATTSARSRPRPIAAARSRPWPTAPAKRSADCSRGGRIDAIIAMGGGAGTTIGTAAMRALPLGIPKVMVSTLASGDVRGFVGVKDIVMIPAIVDISGLNRISRGVFTRAAAAVCGMVEAQVPEGDDAPLITASMFGNTTKCVEAARATHRGGRLRGARLPCDGRRRPDHGEPDRGGARRGRTGRDDHGVGGRAGRRRDVCRADPARGCRAHRHPRGDRARMPRHGELLGTAHPAGEVPRPPHLSAQSETNADPDRSRRECRAGTDHRRQTEHVNRTRGRLLSTAGHLGDLRTRRPVPLARSGCGAARVAPDTSPEGHSRFTSWICTSTTRASPARWRRACWR